MDKNYQQDIEDFDDITAMTDREFEIFVRTEARDFMVDNYLIEMQIKDGHGHRAKLKRKYASSLTIDTDITNSKLIYTEED